MRRGILGLLLLSAASARAQTSSDAEPIKRFQVSAAELAAIDDPMLVPVAPARRTLASWRVAAAYVRAGSTDVTIAVGRVRQAQAQTRVALAAYLPTLAASGRYIHQFITNGNDNARPLVTASGDIAFSSQVRDTLAATVGVEQKVVDLAAWDRIDIGKLVEQERALSLEATVRLMLFSVADQILAVVTAERAAELNRSGLRAALEQLALVRKRYELGGGTTLDVVRAQQSAADARGALVQGDDLLHEAREALGLALGSTEETGVARGMDINGLAREATASCTRVATAETRADVLAARKRLEVAKRNASNVWYGFLPTLSAQSAVHEVWPEPSSYPNPTWNVSALLTVPLWDGGARYGELRNARAAQSIAAAEAAQELRSATIEVQRAQRKLEVAQGFNRVLREQRDLAAKNEEMTTTMYATGAATSLELVTAAEERRRAELNVAFSDFGLIRARLNSILALATCPL